MTEMYNRTNMNTAVVIGFIFGIIAMLLLPILINIIAGILSPASDQTAPAPSVAGGGPTYGPQPTVTWVIKPIYFEDGANFSCFDSTSGNFAFNVTRTDVAFCTSNPNKIDDSCTNDTTNQVTQYPLCQEPPCDFDGDSLGMYVNVSTNTNCLFQNWIFNGSSTGAFQQVSWS